MSARLFAGVTQERLRTAIGRACRDTGTPHWPPHALRHRRISLLHRQGESWAEIGARVGQRSKLVTAHRYSHALIDYRELDRAKLLAGRNSNGRAEVTQQPAGRASAPSAPTRPG